jgi:hypothetical protein
MHPIISSSLALSLEDEEEVMSVFKDFGHSVFALEDRDDGAASKGENLIFDGMQVVWEELNEESEDVRKPVPMSVQGNLTGRNGHSQVFVKTKSILVDGMCGCPVLRKNVHEDYMRDRKDSFVPVSLGMLEGIVPDDYVSEVSQTTLLRGEAIYVEAKDISEMLRDVEIQCGRGDSYSAE